VTTDHSPFFHLARSKLSQTSTSPSTDRLTYIRKAVISSGIPEGTPIDKRFQIQVSHPRVNHVMNTLPPSFVSLVRDLIVFNIICRNLRSQFATSHCFSNSNSANFYFSVPIFEAQNATKKDCRSVENDNRRREHACKRSPSQRRSKYRGIQLLKCLPAAWPAAMRVL
jgi:hypothetical protein